MQTALIALDSKQLITILRKMLEGLGFSCISVETVEQLVNSMSEKQPSILFTDWYFSGEKAEDFLPKISSDSKVVFVSGEKSIQSIQRALDLGADEYIMKPFDNEILQSKLSLVGLL